MPPVRIAKDQTFTVRYNTKPDSSLTQLNPQGDQYVLSGDSAEYRGSGQPGKEVEAVLVWDSMEQEYVLRMINHNLKVSRTVKRLEPPAISRSRAATPAFVSTPINVPPSTATTPLSAKSESSESESDADDFGDLANELEGELSGKLGDDEEEEESEEE